MKRKELLNQYQITESDLDNFDEFLNKFTDIPVSVPNSKLFINKVGTIENKAVVQVRNFIKPALYIPLVCDINLYVELEPGQRGIHMSRLEESLRDISRKNYAELEDFAEELSKNVSLKQDCKKVFIDIKGMALVDRPTIRSKKTSTDPFYLTANIALDKSLNDLNIYSGIQAYNITACPCTRAYSKYYKAQELIKYLPLNKVNLVLNNILTFSHSQRGLVTLKVENSARKISSGNLFEVIDNSTHLVYNLLKRSDEHELVRLAHESPQFTEDVVRDVCFELLSLYSNALESDSLVRIESQLIESIHAHSVHAIIEGNVSDILNQLKN